MHTIKSFCFITVFLIATSIISCFGIDSKKEKNKIRPVESTGFSVVELFTSEGCSSCPAADELVNKLVKEGKKDVYVLSYHVDYWNRLGWKDEFSQAAFSDRQKQYASQFSLESVYTPQIVVNGTTQFVGSDETKLRSSINNSGALSGLSMTTENIHSIVRVNYRGVGNNPVLLNIALIQSEAFTDVKRGENRGRKLHHVNIVRELSTLTTTSDSGSIDMQIPQNLSGMLLQLIVFSQQKNDLKITGVALAHL